MLKVLFFASLREALGQDQLRLDSHRATTVAELREAMLADHPEWKDSLTQPKLMVAVNQSMGRDETPLKDGDEVAFFPPVTGG
ncbi:MAG: molybdopterin converting factor subunit 1 [Oleiphilaceae bacterium]|nr:molybdopterin converting factor subunit 1 [Oleiphilaceae bacterium]